MCKGGGACVRARTRTRTHTHTHAHTHTQLAELGLPAAVEADEVQSGVPDAVWARVAEVQSRGGVEALTRLMDSNNRRRRSAEQRLEAAEGALGKEEADDGECRAKFGSAWSR